MMKWCVCEDCRQTFYVEGKGGPRNNRCPKHAAEKRRKDTRERVRKLREKKAKENKPFIVHVKKFGGKHQEETFCGAKQTSEEVGRALLENGKTIYRYCKTCRAAFFKAHGVRLPE